MPGFNHQTGSTCFMALAAVIGLIHVGPAESAPTATQNLFLPAQSLDASVRQISERFEQPFVFTGVDDTALSVPAVKGHYTLSQVLTALLKQTGLTYQITNDGIVISPVKTDDKQSRIEEVAVTGIRASLDISRQRKRQNQVISDVIAANDIASYPDRNLAESMQRIPGMSITREAGEGRQIMLRGLAPDFTLVTLNGMTVLANNDSPMDSRLQKQRDRSFDLNLFATDLFNEIQVLKTYDAELPSGGMAGIVALTTAHPFDHPGLHWNVSGQLGENQFTESLSKRGAAMVSNTRGNWGALFSVSWGERDYQEWGANTFRWRNITPEGADTSALDPELVSRWQNGELWIPRGNRYSVWQSTMDRTGVGASLEYKNDNHRITLDWLNGKLAGERFEYHLYPRGSRSTPVIEGKTRITAAEVNAADELVFARYEDAQAATESRYQRVATTYNQWVLNSEHQWSAAFTGRGVFGWAHSRYDIPTSNKAYLEGETDMSIDYRRDARFADIRYQGDLNSPSFWKMHELDAETYFAQTDFVNARYTIHYKADDDLSWKVGVEDVRFRNQTDFYEIQDLLALRWQSGVLDSRVHAAIAAPLNAHPRFNWLQLETNNAFKQFGLPWQVAALKETDAADEATHVAQSDKVQEHRQALFAAVIVEQGSWLINAGVRTEHERVSVRVSDSAESKPRILSASHWLPALNICYSLTPDNIVRLAMSKTLGRPQLDDLAAPVRYNADEQILYGVNHALKPYSAYNIDIAWERYLSETDRFAVSAYSKYLDDYIVYVSDHLLTENARFYQGIVNSDEYDNLTLVTPQNAEQAWLHGIEVSAQLEIQWPWAPQYHLGVVGSASYTRGSVTFHNANTGQELSRKSMPFLSPWLANVTAYWEGYDVSFRLSASYRDGYLARVDSQTLQDEDETGFEESLYLDGVITWQMGDNWEWRFEATNLTNQREIQYSDSSHRPYNTTLSGRNYYVGVTYRY